MSQPKRDILLRNIYHLVEGNGTRRRGVDLLIEGDKIAAIGASLDVQRDHEVIDCSSKLVIPGLVNTHHHMYQTLQRNILAVQNCELFDWLKGLYPIWRHLTADAVNISTQLACAELLKTGCTCSSDHHYVFPQGVTTDLSRIQLEAARKTGIRFCATRGSMSVGESRGGLPPDSVVQDESDILAHSEQLIRDCHDDSALSMCRIALAPCSPFSVSPELMQQTAELARKYGVYLHTHLAETIDEQDYCEQAFGKRPLALMQDWGWVGPDVWLAHGIHFNDDELAVLADTQTGVAHCPSSNMRLGSGTCRVLDMDKRGVRVGLGVDGSASNDTSDMIGELRSCLLLHRLQHGAAAITAEEVLRLATQGSATLLGWDTIGQLTPGYAADLAIIEMDRLDYAGALNDPLAAIMFSGTAHYTTHTIVNGDVVVRDGKLVSIDEAALRDQANQLSKAMLDAEGHDTRWML